MGAKSTDVRDDLVPVRPLGQLAARIGLWSLVALGFVGGVVGLLRPSPSLPSATAQDPGDAVAGPDVVGFAELAVGAWLEAGVGEAESVSGLFLEDPADLTSGAAATRVRRLTTVRVRRVDMGYWAVTVAAHVVERDRDGAEFPATWFVEIGVVSDDGGLGAAGTPALVGAPSPVPQGWEVAGPTPGTVEPDDPLAATVQGFLGALLTGGGDVARYAAPGVDVAAPDPVPFVEVHLRRLGVAGQPSGGLRARAEATGTTAAGAQRTVSYQIELVERGGRWEITSLSGAPTLESTGDASPPSTVDPPAEPSSTSIAANPGA
jgi:Conjugative transposon protein TcpC